LRSRVAERHLLGPDHERGFTCRCPQIPGRGQGRPEGTADGELDYSRSRLLESRGPIHDDLTRRSERGERGAAWWAAGPARKGMERSDLLRKANGGSFQAQGPRPLTTTLTGPDARSKDPWFVVNPANNETGPDPPMPRARTSVPKRFSPADEPGFEPQPARSPSLAAKTVRRSSRDQEMGTIWGQPLGHAQGTPPPNLPRGGERAERNAARAGERPVTWLENDFIPNRA